MRVEAEITAVRGIGPQTAKLLARLDIHTVWDLLCHKPAYYKDLSRITPIYLLEEEQLAVVRACVMTPPHWIRRDRKFSLFTFSVSDGSGSLSISVFNTPYSFSKYTLGGTYLFLGKPKEYRGRLQMENPEVLPEGGPLGLRAYYPLTAGLSQHALRQFVGNALQSVEFPADYTPGLREAARLLPQREAFCSLHCPATPAALEEAQRSLALREAWLFLERMEQSAGKAEPAKPLRAPAGTQEAYLAKLPFRCTGAQLRAMGEIAEDLSRPVTANRLIQGDVGSGKTAVAMYAVFWAARCGAQSLLLAPTSLLAAQHFRMAQSLFGERAALLTGATPAGEREEIRRKAAAGEIDVLVSTHAALYEQPAFGNLQLLVIDEQHRFGVLQRSKMARQYPGLHTITMSATPIPRSLAMILHGSAEISVLDELPPGRTPVKTFLIGKNKRAALYDWLAERVAAGEKAYIICPLLEPSEGIAAVSVQEMQQGLQKRYPAWRIGILHGRMRAEEKAEVMRRFATGEISVLISTTVVEVGVDVPDATIMIVENADRFGLAQLHQLRGRVGRGSLASYCYFVSDGAGQERLRVLKECSDGFAIARKDLAYRGAGNFFGVEQHGETSFRFLDLYQDMALLEEAKVLWQAMRRDFPQDYALLEAQVRREAAQEGNAYLAI